MEWDMNGVLVASTSVEIFISFRAPRQARNLVGLQSGISVGTNHSRRNRADQFRKSFVLIRKSRAGQTQSNKEAAA
jgi:hypothetical protein